VSFFFTALLAGARLLISRDEQRSRAQLPLSFSPAIPWP
jgi:hypothetical protein